jgi:hypothetical protein
MEKKSYSLSAFIVLALLITYGCKTNEVAPQKVIVEIRDVDGNLYHAVIIGAQTWLVENLKVTHYRNGDPIPYSSTELTSGAFCNYNNDASITMLQ